MKRANLEGRQREDGRWEVRVNATTITGAKVRKSFYGETKKDAQSKAHEFIFESHRTPGQSVRYDQLIKAWEDSWEVENVPDNTQRSYRDSLKHLKKTDAKGKHHDFYHQPVDSVLLPRISLFLDTLTGSTHDHVRTIFSQLLNFGKRKGLCTQNPLAGVRVKRKATNKHARCTPQEFGANLEFIWAGFHPFLYFLAHTGLRPWKEGIVTEKSQIRIIADVTCVQVGESKTDAGEGRVVPIIDRYLLDYIDNVESGPLFPGITEIQVRNAWKYARECSMIEADIYGLRSLAITTWCRADVPLDIVMARAGHADLATTLKIYNEVSAERSALGRGVNEGVKLSDLIGGRTNGELI